MNLCAAGNDRLAVSSVRRKNGSVNLDVYLERHLKVLAERDLLRDPDECDRRAAVRSRAEELGVSFVDLSSNDYLGLANVSRETCSGLRLGSAASRLIQGTWPEHSALEAEVAEWVGADAALLFTSAFSANLGTISALAGAESVILSDALNHASIVDGCRLARAQVAVIPHLDLGALETALIRSAQAPVRWVVTESYYSMDGDAPNLPALRALCDRYRAFLVVDEAHALGVFGSEGAGRCAAFGIRPDVLIGAFGKAVGAQGGFVAGTAALRTFLWNRARSFVYSTAPSPELCAQTLNSVRQVRKADDLRAELHARAEQFRNALSRAGVAIAPGGEGPIVAVVVGSSRAALEAARRLQAEGILAHAVRPPTVPEGQARLRLTVTSNFPAREIERVASAIQRACRLDS
ncbi:MAG TPA: 8-amino-7-oxononanoate synthase [Polyangiaceae bacterium]|nr:8-amino-7-oxononanoate synthase [Polyangiaceae bacterium]